MSWANIAPTIPPGRYPSPEVLILRIARSEEIEKKIKKAPTRRDPNLSLFFLKIITPPVKIARGIKKELRPNV